MKRSRAEMIADTRGKLISAGRQAFGDIGYATSSMDDFTAKAGLTRGALHHHFKDKRGLFEAVVTQIDAEMTERLEAVSSAAPDAWTGFVEECVAYVEMAMEPEIQRILFRDGPAVLGDPAGWVTANGCIRSMTSSLARVREQGLLREVEPEAVARMLSGATIYAAQWIALSDEPAAVSKKAVTALRVLMEGLLKPEAVRGLATSPRIPQPAAL